MFTTQLRMAAFAAAALAAVTASAVAQTTIVVNDTRDLADHDLTDGICDADATMAGAQCTLRAAIENANLIGGSVDIHLGPHVYALTRWGTDDVSRWGDLDIYGGTLTELSLHGVPGLTVIDASPLAAQGFPDRVLDVRSTVSGTARCDLHFVTITGGAGVNDGAGIRHATGELILHECALANNHANDHGGALYALGGTVVVTESRIGPGNTAQHGAGICVDGASMFDAGVSVFTDNHATGKGGGLDWRSGTGALTQCSFDQNGAQSGGGMRTRVVGHASECAWIGNQATGTGGGVAIENGALTIERSHFEVNTARQGGGLAIAALGSGAVRETRFIENIATLNGGGLENSGMLELRRSVLMFNHAMNVVGVGGGGGAHLFGATTMVNCTVSGNDAIAGEGGGVYVLGTNAQEISACTIARNHAATGGVGIHLNAVFGAPAVTLVGTILAENIDLTGISRNAGGSGAIASVGFNLDDDGTAALSAPGDQSFVFAALAPLALNGGPTETHALLPGSAAIDAGACFDVAGNVITTDQRGVTRSGLCDTGAFESSFTASACPLLLSQRPDGQIGAWADVECPQCTPGSSQTIANGFTLATSEVVGRVTVWGGMHMDNHLPIDDFTLTIRADAGGAPGAIIFTECGVRTMMATTGQTLFGVDEWRIELLPHQPPTLAPGTYFIEVFTDTSSDSDTFFLESGTLDPLHGVPGIFYDTFIPAQNWMHDPTFELAMDVHCGTVNACPADLDRDGIVGFSDLLEALAAFGASCTRADLDQDGQVTFSDIVTILAAWGPCP